MPKPKDWDIHKDGEWNGRKPGCYKWYEIQDTTNYYTLFEKPKIIWPDIAKESRFAFDSKGLYVEATAFIVPLNDLYLLGLLNSKLLWYFLCRATPVLGDVNRGGRIRIKQIYVEELPIRKIDFSKSTDKAMHDEMVKLVQRMLEMNKEKQAKTKGFFTALCVEENICDSEGEVIPEPPSNKELGEWWNWNFIQFSKYLRKKDPKKLHGKTAALEERFRKASKDLRELSRQINDTDQKIDCLVYKLYALTPEEIEIVEGRENPCED